jgi:light-regulated signal transduction histidine kinase (bacteriophytochrome)
MNKENVESEEIERLEKALQERTRQLENMTKELERFSYSVSHDLRAPLRAIEGFTKIVVEDYADKLDDEGKRFLHIIDTSSRKMTGLLDDLLILSRLGRQEMKPTQCDMEKIVTVIWDELRSDFASRKIDLKILPLPKAWGDSSLIQQIWKELLSNAIKFTAQKEVATIEISGKKEGARTVYSIQDNGVGFDMNASEKLFGVFQRLHAAEEFEGSGIGLAVVQRLVRRHGGEAWAEGTPGVGAQFHFALPQH